MKISKYTRVKLSSTEKIEDISLSLLLQLSSAPTATIDLFLLLGITTILMQVTVEAYRTPKQRYLSSVLHTRVMTVPSGFGLIFHVTTWA